ncbi:MAG TPA: biotin--[acetyl-CoA-carboxylase] ligase [Pyrinomonadaceae bacterium]
MNFTILRFDSIDSTNTEALKRARDGADEGVCVVAKQQTAGRGRHGRVWESPDCAGLYLSIVLRPKTEPKYLPLITLAAGVAVHDALTEIGLMPDIKWPNDVLVNERKISGILAEMCENRSGVAVIVGIGINLTSNNFPAEISENATSIEAELKRKIASHDLEAPLLKYFDNFYSLLIGDRGPENILDEWNRRSSYAKGKGVRVATENGPITGITDGLETNGALRVRTNGGAIAIVQAGDVQLLREGTD